MIDEQIRARGVHEQAVLDAMRAIPREEFVPAEAAEAAYDDRALPIQAGQTISQPFIVAFMTAQLDVGRDCRVLEVGTGSGYQTAVLAVLAKHVYTIERIDELRRLAERRLADLGLSNVTIRTGDGSMGLAEFAPYDRIIVTAAAPEIPQGRSPIKPGVAGGQSPIKPGFAGSLTAQLAVGGRLIIPVGGETDQTIIRVDRLPDRFVETPLLACRFVKLIGQEGWHFEKESPPST